jgi:GTP-binding protein
MIPVIALVGRPNVGKSTLFNYLTRTRDALVADYPGLTRDRQYGRGVVGDIPYIVVDTGGLSLESETVDSLMAKQTQQAIDESDVVFFLVDAHAGVTAADEEIAQRLRQTRKEIILLVNKIDGVDPDMAIADFYGLGVGDPRPISSTQGRNIKKVLADVFSDYEVIEEDEDEGQEEGIRIGIVGRPNVGKSTLVNRLVGEERVVACDMPGTTRDSIEVNFEQNGKHYVLVDTAGVRRRTRVTETIEKFSVIKAMQAIEDADVVIVVMDAHAGIAEQDVRLLGYCLDAGCGVIIAINKWDGLDSDEREEVKNALDRKLAFIDYAEIHFISALHGSGVGHLMESVEQAYNSAMTDMPTAALTRVLESAVAAHQPPLVRGHRIKLRYAHQGGKNPPVIVIHGNQTDAIPNTYKRYLNNYFRKELHLVGTPLRLEFKTGENPYKGKKNPLTDRQRKRRKRLMKHVKK